MYLLAEAGLEPENANSLFSGTYENPDTPSGAKCGAIESGSSIIPPELVELVQRLASLPQDQQQALLQLAKNLSTGQNNPVGQNPPDRVEI